MGIHNKKALIEQLLTYITENKRNKMNQVLQNRTRYVTVLLEDLFQPHNASAVLRTCDSFGVQDAHVVEARYAFKAVPTIAMGSAQWLNINRYSSINEAVSALKNKGYRIVATTPHTDSYELPQLPLDQKTVLMFGSEQTGLSQEALSLADMFVKIPMYGFVESFNVSVSVALCLYELITELHTSSYNWRLSEVEKENIMLEWICSVSKTALLVKKEYERNQKNEL